ncbi:MAG: biotin transporter BioY [Candidatus Omnitrophica bacterium]|nr:biotin transporter BioY [Candidatus Omnitrophota bacterium]
MEIYYAGRRIYRTKGEIIKSFFFTKIGGICLFIILTALGAYIYIPLPFTPVPLTLQSFFVLLSGAVLGPWLGLLSQLGYLGLGMLGIPVFSGGRAGLLHLLGPSGGYLWGFLFASWGAGKLVYKKRRNTFFLFASFLLGTFIIYLFGLSQLRLFIKQNLLSLFSKGVLPFILPDFLKILLATYAYRYLQK